MPGTKQDATLITSARIPRTLDADQRHRRYLWSMLVRVVCFIGACFVPLPWNIALIAGAAFIPGVAVVLANASDKHGEAERPGYHAEPEPALALTSGVVVPGLVSDEEAA